MKSQIWVFDFDKTLTRRDTTLPLLVYGCGPVVRCIRCVHYYLLAVAVKLGLMDHGNLKDKLFGRYFNGWTPERWQEHSSNFAETIEFSKLYYSIDWNDSTREIWVISASPASVIQCCFPETVKVLGSEMAFNSQGLEKLSVHMHGEAKQAALKRKGVNRIDCFFSDHYFDSSLAAMAREIYFVKRDHMYQCDDVNDFIQLAKEKIPSFPLTSCPPARTSFSLWGIVAEMREAGKLEQEIADCLGSRKVIIGDAWVNMLAEGLRCMAQARKKNEVILPAYSCNEFTKAILLAGLKPVYAPLDTHCRLQTSAIESLVTANTLAVLAVNNTGVVSDLTALRVFCDEHSCWLVEDGGYSFLGTDETGKPYGSFGHATVINTSEGKTIPCGGAIWALNSEEMVEVFTSLSERLAGTEPRGKWREFMSLMIYRIGSSIAGFSLYRLLKSIAGRDLKTLLSAEPSRHAENYATGNLHRENGGIVLDPEHVAHLNAITIRPWNAIRKSCARQIIRNAEVIRRKRNQRLQEWKKALGTAFQWIDLPVNCMPVKQPFLMPPGLFTDAEIEQFAWQGVNKQYPTSWPMASTEFENDSLFYEQAFTLPLHDGVSKNRIHRLAAILRSRKKLRKTAYV